MGACLRIVTVPGGSGSRDRAGRVADSRGGLGREGLTEPARHALQMIVAPCALERSGVRILRVSQRFETRSAERGGQRDAAIDLDAVLPLGVRSRGLLHGGDRTGAPLEVGTILDRFEV